MTDQNDDTPFEAESEESPPVPELPTLEAAPPGPDPGEQIQEIRRKATEAFKSGAHDAREAFEKSFPRAKEDLGKGINDASYAIGYAISFGSTLIKELTPDSVSDGFERGTKAGSKAAEEVIEHRKNRSTDVPDDGEPADL